MENPPAFVISELRLRLQQKKLLLASTKIYLIYKKQMHMEKQIACCGFDCSTCEVRIATVKNDDALRVKIAEEWKVRYHKTDIFPEMINCAGCREAGVINNRCELCEIRKCVKSKNFKTCVECIKLEDCTLLKKVHQHVPEAMDNLKSLK